jgi:lipoyl(octanoyl) transferase
MHRIISSALATFGVAADLVQCGSEQKLGDVLCFQHQTAGDLTVSGHKVVGSAQRKQRGALMQHGGILLAKSPHTPDLPGLRELADRTLASDAVAEAIRRAVQVETGREFRDADWTDRERTRIRELVADKYSTTIWNEKR